MIKGKNSHLTLVIYQDHKVAKCFSINKDHLKALVIIAPCLILISLFITFSSIYYTKKTHQELKKYNPKLVSKLQTMVSSLEIDSKQFKTERDELLAKLNTPENDNNFENSNYLYFIQPTKSFKKRTHEETIDIENIKAKHESDSIQISFNLIKNEMIKTRISGFITILLKNGNSISVYPKLNQEYKNGFLKYSEGESFSFNRLRPVKAKMKIINKSSPYSFYIFIFSFTGDLIYQKRIEGKELGNVKLN